MARIILFVIGLSLLAACASPQAVRDLTRRSADNVNQLKSGLVKFDEASKEIENKLADVIAERKKANAENADVINVQDILLELSGDERKLQFYTKMQELSDEMTASAIEASRDKEEIANEIKKGLEQTAAPAAQLTAVIKKLAELLERDSTQALIDYLTALAGEIRKAEEKAEGA